MAKDEDDAEGESCISVNVGTFGDGAEGVLGVEVKEVSDFNRDTKVGDES